MEGIEAFLDTYGLLAVFGVMLLKEFGVPVPIPGDLIMLGVAARSAQGRMSPVAAFAIILIPMLIGGLFQYTIARGPGRKLIYRLGRIIGLTAERLDHMMERIRRGGSAAVTIGLTTPGLRIATTPASGLANLAPRKYIPGLILGSTFFLGWHFAIGYAGGAALAVLNLPAPVIAAILIAVLALGVLAALIRRSRRAARQVDAPLSETVAEWADASCPVCSAIKLAQTVQGPLII